MKSNNLVAEEIKIKGMICSRCIKVLKQELNAVGASVIDIRLGMVNVQYNPHEVNRSILDEIINSNEFDEIKDDKLLLAEETKRWVFNYVWETLPKTTLKTYLLNHINRNYYDLSKNFSQIFSKTIERYCVELKIERAKELIEDKGKTFTEIAYVLGYNNLSAMSRQFKLETGLTMNQYKSLGISKRIPIDKI